jgi:hypothetical protein
LRGREFESAVTADTLLERYRLPAIEREISPSSST